MCLRYVRVDNSNPCGTSSAFVPCGYCVDCRRKAQQAWRFRLVSEAATLKKKGWNIAFCTLTYEDSKLPYIPEECFVDKSAFRPIPCFNRSHVVDFITALRNHFKRAPFRFVGENRIRYFVASEYGSFRHRPHMHMILAWPSSVSYRDMHKVCSDHWNYGFLFPRDFRGDGKCLSFEVVGDPSKVLHYVSKYACKDIDYYNETKSIDFYDGEYDEDSPEYALAQVYRNCKPFHVQSRSLGFESIKNMTYEQKRDVYVNGLGFFGDGEMYSVPLYLKNKLVYDNYYIYDSDGKRLCRRKASAFFDKYKSEIFEEKSKFYTSLITASISSEYFTRRGVDKSTADFFAGRCRFYYDESLKRFDSPDRNILGKLFLAYYGQDSIYWKDVSLVDSWYVRYASPENIERHQFECYHAPDSPFPLGWLNNLFDCVVGANTYVGVSCVGEREEQDKRLRDIRDFFNNQLK